MQRKIFKWTAISFGIITILFIALGFHLKDVTNNFYRADGPQLQLARIDFSQDIDSLKAAEIQAYINNIDGVTKSYFNIKDDILVYSFYAGTLSTTEIYNDLMQHEQLEAERFVLPEELKASGCPVMSGHTSGFLNMYKNVFSFFNL